MQVPDHLQAYAGQVLGCELDAAIRKGYWAVLYGLVPKPDGDRWCVLLGEDLQIGIAGFGDTPEKAIVDFEEKMRTARSPQSIVPHDRGANQAVDDTDSPSLHWRECSYWTGSKHGCSLCGDHVTCIQLPSALRKALQDNCYNYYVGMKDGRIIECEGAELVEGGEFIRLIGVGFPGDIDMNLERGIEIRISEILWAVDGAS